MRQVVTLLFSTTDESDGVYVTQIDTNEKPSFIKAGDTLNVVLQDKTLVIEIKETNDNGNRTR